MTRYLLDANLSPKVGRFLEVHFGFDVISLQRLRRSELPDHDVVQMARSTGRVIITLDRDYLRLYFRVRNPGFGVIYLDLPNEYRWIPEINQILFDFFASYVSEIELEQTLITLTPTEVRVHRD